MMRFPPRLLWQLSKVRLAQKVFGSSRYPWALRLDLSQLPANVEIALPNGVTSSSEVSSRDSQALSQVRASSAPIVWIGGDPPLQHARIGHLAREISNTGRTVFVEIDGTLLRRRIHEFRPVSRLCLVLPLNGIETIIFPDFIRNQLLELANFISTIDVDGWIHKRPPAATNDATISEALQSACELIPSRHWRSFSALLDVTATSAQSSFGKKRIANPVAEKVEKVSTREPREVHDEGLRAL
jgi:hypothetical protein